MTARLLVAHCDEALLDIYQSFFWDHGFDVEVAANVMECLATLPEFEPDVLILQQELRGGSGDLVLEHLRAQSNFDTSVLLLTNNPHISDLQVFVSPPIYACIRMPARLYTLLGTVCSAPRRIISRFDLSPVEAPTC